MCDKNRLIGFIVYSLVRVAYPQTIVINEIYYNPPTSQGSDSNYEFLEIYNASNATVDISGYYFSGIGYTFPSGTSMNSGALIVLANNSNNYSGSIEWASGGLTNTGETITLYDGAGNTIDIVDYDDSSPWPTPPDEDGPSLELIDASTDNNTASNWTYSYHTGGTPGYANQSIQLAGSAGWRMMTIPLQGKSYNNLLSDLWTQGFTGADITTGTANVYTYNGSAWSSIANQADIPTPGTGFLVYVFSDDNNDGTTEGFPKTITLDGSEHTPTVSVTTTESTWSLLGNPFTHTIDADKLSLGGSGSGTNDKYETAVYVWDDESGAFKSYDASTSSGTLAGGLIEPFQSFFLQSKSGGTQFDFKSSAKAIRSGVFYKIATKPQVIIHASSGAYTDVAILNISDPDQLVSRGAIKLKPVDARHRVLIALFDNSTPMGIMNVSLEEPITIDFDVFKVDSNWRLNPSHIDLDWQLNNIPQNISVKLVDRETGKNVNLKEIDFISFDNEVVSTPDFDNNSVGPIPRYRPPRFELVLIPETRLSVQTASNRFHLSTAYPNPFNTSTTIEFELPISGLVEMAVYNIRGQKVVSIVNEVLSAGQQSVHWDATKIPSGIYFCQLKMGSTVKTNKLALIK
ncbi:MAG: T9SS type A sorting domain-containing protein [Candidatus Marinimicrobia bacterium]|nr:T9SS type A sorting domain-containing protein [Candidatus Neomarinimicrobiota bacterium]MBT5995072.1 T9SS type A sorting domain-containing protein [Candidatus Neomarinimicrobiota bacterium]